MDFGAIVLGAFLASLFGYFGSVALEFRRTKEENRIASFVIANELFRVIDWHERILALKKEKDVFEVWGMFLPTNSLSYYRVIIQKILTEEEYRDVEDAYIRFSIYDRQMQGVLNTWMTSSQGLPKGPALRWAETYWSSLFDEETIKLVEQLKLVYKKLAG